jgi:RND family efflux transporter MFP subunit
VSQLKDDLAALRIERTPVRRGSRRWIGWLAALALFAGAGAGAWAWVTRERPVDVQVATATERAAGARPALLNASGYVTARRRATVSSKITGKVVEVNVEEGMAVREGQVLARLDDSNARAALLLAEAQAEAARRAVTENEVRLHEGRLTLKRRQQLLKEGVATPAELDQAQADVDSGEARVAAARQQVLVAERQVAMQQVELDNTIIRAPFSGVAVSRDAQAGEMVSPVSAGGGFTRTGICTIVDMRSLEIEVDVNEAYIGRVRPGQDVTAVLDAYPDWQIPARVITTVPTADRQKATVMVRIGFRQLDPRILPDMGVKITLLGAAEAAADASSRPAVLVPKSAVLTGNGRSVVFVPAGGKAERRAVTTGTGDGDRVEILAGLRAGERVISPVPAGLRDGSRIEVR